MAGSRSPSRFRAFRYSVNTVARIELEHQQMIALPLTDHTHVRGSSCGEA